MSRRQLIEKLDKTARELYRICWGNIDYDFGDDDMIRQLMSGEREWHKVEFVRSNHLVFWGTDRHCIELKDIRPKGTADLTVDEPVFLDEKIADLNSVEVINSSPCELTREYTFTEESSMETSIDIGVEIGLELRQQVGYGSEIAQINGETEVTASVNTSFSLQNSWSKSECREVTNSITVPPNTKVTLTSRRSVSKFKQRIRANCDLDFTILFHSPGNWVEQVDDIEEMNQIFAGFGDKGHALSKHFVDRRDGSAPWW